MKGKSELCSPLKTAVRIQLNERIAAAIPDKNQPVIGSEVDGFQTKTADFERALPYCGPRSIQFQKVRASGLPNSNYQAIISSRSGNDTIKMTRKKLCPQDVPGGAELDDRMRTDCNEGAVRLSGHGSE